MLQQHLCRSLNPFERNSPAVGDVEQRVVPVREVQNPQHRELCVAFVGLPGNRSIESPPAELRLALRVGIQVRQVVLEEPENGTGNLE